MTTVSSYFVGGIDRWLLDFAWQCPGGAVGQAKSAKLQVRLELPMSPPIDATHRTFYMDEGQAAGEYQLQGASIVVAGSGVPEFGVSLRHTRSLLSIRREGDELIGGLYFVGEDASGNHDTTLAGPFRVPVPTF